MCSSYALSRRLVFSAIRLVAVLVVVKILWSIHSTSTITYADSLIAITHTLSSEMNSVFIQRLSLRSLIERSKRFVVPGWLCSVRSYILIVRSLNPALVAPTYHAAESLVVALPQIMT